MTIAWDLGAAINAYCLLYILSNSDSWVDEGLLGVGRILGFSFGPIILTFSMVDNPPLNVTTVVLLWSITYIVGLNSISIYIKNRRHVNVMATLDSNRRIN